ncbi:MAG: type II secretion system protein [Campylobacterota bacterium]|nr:type II secretion system protein [Campylobacterota bacterium]
MYKHAFTLIELLVVLIIITIVMALVAPMGMKTLESFENFTNNSKQYNKLKLSQFYSFIALEPSTAQYNNKNYYISSKGVIYAIEKSNDDD